MVFLRSDHSGQPGTGSPCGPCGNFQTTTPASIEGKTEVKPFTYSRTPFPEGLFQWQIKALRLSGLRNHTRSHYSSPVIPVVSQRYPIRTHTWSHLFNQLNLAFNRLIVASTWLEWNLPHTSPFWIRLDTLALIICLYPLLNLFEWGIFPNFKSELTVSQSQTMLIIDSDWINELLIYL